VNIVGGFEELAGVSSVDKIIADICPQDVCGSFCGMVNIKAGDQNCWEMTTEATCNNAYLWAENGGKMAMPCHYTDDKCGTDSSGYDWAKCETDPDAKCPTTTTTAAR